MCIVIVIQLNIQYRNLFQKNWINDLEYMQGRKKETSQKWNDSYICIFFDA